MKLLNTFLAILLCYFQLLSQEIKSGGGEAVLMPGRCLTPFQHKEPKYLLKEKLLFIKKNNISNLLKFNKDQNFIWPVKQINEITDPGIQGVSFFVDHNEELGKQGAQTAIDYNCLTKTYDTENYNHSGTDIFIYPFHWDLFKLEAANVIAAKDGIIISKFDNNFDMQCEFCNNCNWNAIYLLHNDGTVSIYGHLKSGTLTEKDEFDFVLQGDYLGKVGSSGNSNGPHLHFEIQDESGNVIDPFEGSCNVNQNKSLWEEQRPYKLPMINALKTSSLPPVFSQCSPEDEKSFETKIFNPGDEIVLTAYLTDQIASSILNLKVISPDGDEIVNFNKTLTQDFNTSYWYWVFKLSNTGKSGEYSLRGKYESQIVDYSFQVSNPLSDSELSPIRKWFNYSTNEISLDLHKDEIAIVYSSLGNKIMTLNSGKTNSSNLPIGIYYVVLVKKGKHLNSEKLVKY